MLAIDVKCSHMLLCCLRFYVGQTHWKPVQMWGNKSQKSLQPSAIRQFDHYCQMFFTLLCLIFHQQSTASDVIVTLHL